MNRELDERIRERAYAIWEEEGHPEGQDFVHWMRAVEQIQAEDAGEGILGGSGTVLSDPDRPNVTLAAGPKGDNDQPRDTAVDTPAADDHGHIVAGPEARAASQGMGSGQSAPADSLHAASLPGASAAPAAQGTARPSIEIGGKASDKHRKLAQDYLKLGGNRRAKIDDNLVSTREWRKDPPDAERFWSEKIEGLPETDRRQVELLLPTINTM